MTDLARLIIRAFSKPDDGEDNVFPVLMFIIIGLLVALAGLLELRYPPSDVLDMF
jgi:hypothetical protein